MVEEQRLGRVTPPATVRTDLDLLTARAAYIDGDLLDFAPAVIFQYVIFSSIPR
jgi:hypothetical protein